MESHEDGHADGIVYVSENWRSPNAERAAKKDDGNDDCNDNDYGPHDYASFLLVAIGRNTCPVGSRPE